MTVVDFTTYTELDDAGEITVTSTKIDFAALAIDEDSYVIKDYGVDNFGDFIHRQTIRFESATDSGAPSGSAVFWALSPTNGVFTWQEMETASVGLMLEIGRSGAGTYFIGIQNVATNTNDFFFTGDPPYTYYIEIERDGSTLTAKMYNNANFTDLADTLSVGCTTDTMRYHIATSGKDVAGPDADVITGYVENFDPNIVAVIAKKNFLMADKMINSMYGSPSTLMGSST